MRSAPNLPMRRELYEQSDYHDSRLALRYVQPD